MKSVTLKLFLLISSAFIAFLSLCLVLETVFFEDFYISKKMTSFETSFEELIRDVNGLALDEDELAELLDEFSRANNARSTVVELLRLPALRNAPRGTGIPSEQSPQEFRPLIETDRETIRNLRPMLDKLSALANESGQAVFTRHNPGGFAYGVSGVAINGKNYLLFASASMQPVGEAVDALKAYYVYIYSAAIFLALCISLAISGFLARPLVAANAKLASDLEKEKRLDSMRKDFIASASHELKTPIGLISGYTEALRDGLAPDEAEQFLDIIADEAAKMDGLVREMLELCMLQDQQRYPELCDINASALIEGCMRRLTSKIHEKLLSVEYETENFFFRADAVKTEQALTNILDNAIRHTPREGSIRISASTRGDYTDLSVENEGLQLSENELSRIWESFYRGDGPCGQGGNYGIGLAIVKKIAELHGGEAYAENTETGVRFGLLLPQTVIHGGNL